MMTRKERDAMEKALTESALRYTAGSEADVPHPTANDAFGAMTTGWAVVGCGGDYARVERACSTLRYHGIGGDKSPSQQRPKALHSTKERALRQLRREVELQCSQRLRRIDLMIEECINEGGAE
jgi:hypothetical protein